MRFLVSQKPCNMHQFWIEQALKRYTKRQNPFWSSSHSYQSPNEVQTAKNEKRCPTKMQSFSRDACRASLFVFGHWYFVKALAIKMIHRKNAWAKCFIKKSKLGKNDRLGGPSIAYQFSSWKWADMFVCFWRIYTIADSNQGG